MSSSGNGAKLSTLNVSLNRILGANNDEDITATSPSTKPLQSDPESKTSISPRLIGKRLYIDGYMYGPKRYHSSTIDWDCVLKYSQSCPAKAVTSNNTTNASLVVYEGPESLQHSHPPRIEDVKRAEELVKRKCNQKQLQKPNHVSKASKAACVFRKRPRAEKPALLEDQQMYGLFLRKFLQKPDFDRQNVIEALEVIYSSKQGCLAGVPTVVECRKKIEQDPEILRKNLNAKIAPITIGKRRSTDLQNDTVDLKIIDEVPVEHDNSVVFHSKIMPDMNAADSTLDEETSSLELDNNNCPLSRVESPLPAEISDSEERPTFLGTIKADMIPAVPAAIPINNLSTCTVTQSTSHQGIPVAKAEIPVDDQMEDIYEIKVEPKRVQREPKEPSVTHPNER
ncbi:hypothetical protein QAD02_006754 [Eretmocerus hayati]|uniref:Uncharacterized protein n=1 Tax=Eretmocerus hayati TaxID=131215 RepID=A0ACC2N236_9HYME|nr:hypothetical protein QAD02_006754 [Eretmocerus hayati]